jgi:hypothetical protein
MVFPLPRNVLRQTSTLAYNLAPLAAQWAKTTILEMQLHRMLTVDHNHTTAAAISQCLSSRTHNTTSVHPHKLRNSILRHSNLRSPTLT